MAGFFEDVGRTGAVRQTVRDLIQTGRAIREEGRAEKDQAIRTGQFDILRAEADRKQQVFDQQERVANQVMPLESVLAGVPPSARKMLEDYGRQNNLIEDVGGVPTISNRNLRAAQQQIGENTVFQKQLDEAALVDVNNSMQQIQSQLRDPAVKDKDRQALGAKLAELQKQQTFVLNSIKTQDAAIRKAVATEEAKRVGKQAAAFEKIDPSKYTPASLRAFERTGLQSDLVAATGTGAKYVDEAAMRKEFTTLSGPFRQIRDSYARIQAAADEPSAAGDLALIFNYMKMLDPGSVVRESEFATAANSAGVPDRIRKTWNRILEGERLAVNTRKDFVTRSDKLFKRQDAQHAQREQTFRTLATNRGFDPDNVAIDLRDPLAGEAAAVGAEAPPVEALQEGVGTKFDNGQVWTLKDGQPVQVQ